MILTEKTLLITVKAYPNPSKKYGETVCCAGIELFNKKWIRLYPIPFRDLDDDKKFKKYCIIKVKCHKATDDNRPESYKVNADSITILDWADTKDNWSRRKSIVLPTLSRSMCLVYKEASEHDKSLALIKPCSINFCWERANIKDQDIRESCYAQLSFLNKRKNSIEQIPFNFYYDFNCYGINDCPGHKFPIIDWEIGQAYRSWQSIYRSEELLLEKIRERWLDRICSLNNDVYFYVGNMKRFRKNFMILGVFYPKRKSDLTP